MAANTPTTPTKETPTRMVSAAPFEVVEADALAVEEPAITVTQLVTIHRDFQESIRNTNN